MTNNQMIGIGEPIKELVPIHIQKEDAFVEYQCPFCYAQPETLEIKLDLVASIAQWYVYCPRCRCCGPIGDSKVLAAELWNKAEPHMAT